MTGARMVDSLVQSISGAPLLRLFGPQKEEAMREFDYIHVNAIPWADIRVVVDLLDAVLDGRADGGELQRVNAWLNLNAPTPDDVEEETRADFLSMPDV